MKPTTVRTFGPGRRRLGGVLVVASLGLIGLMTLMPVAPSITLPHACIVCGPLGGVDFAANVVLFTPLGFGLMWLTGRYGTTVAAAFAVTLAVESLQLLIPGRFASLGDLLANALGAVLGAWVACNGTGWLVATGSQALRLSLGLSALVAAWIVTSAVLLLPAPPSVLQQVQWAVLRVNHDSFPGRIRSVELNDRFLRPALGLHGTWVVDPSSGGTVLRSVIDGPIPATRRKAIIVRTSNFREEGLFFGQWGTAAIIRTHQVASFARLRPIMVKLDGAFGGAGRGDEGNSPVTIEGRSDRRRLTLSRDAGGDHLEVTVRRTPGLGWTVLLPWDVAIDNDWWLLNAAWLAILIVPVAYTSQRARKGPEPDQPAARAWWTPLGLIAASLLGAPLLTGTSHMAPTEWGGVVIGLAAAWALSYLTSHRVSLKAPRSATTAGV